MIVDELRARALNAAKEKDTVAKDILRLALGEVQTAEARAAKPVSDDEAIAILKKLVKSNGETLAATADDATKATLQREIDILTSLLPKNLDVDAIVAALAGIEAAIKEAKAEGQAMGVAMKHLKAGGIANVTAPDVTAAVKKIRGT